MKREIRARFVSDGGKFTAESDRVGGVFKADEDEREVFNEFETNVVSGASRQDWKRVSVG